jgi:hypothetical protein
MRNQRRPCVWGGARPSNEQNTSDQRGRVRREALADASFQQVLPHRAQPPPVSGHLDVISIAVTAAGADVIVEPLKVSLAITAVPDRQPIAYIAPHCDTVNIRHHAPVLRGSSPNTS